MATMPPLGRRRAREIAPPRARGPEELLALRNAALSSGDIPAALSLYTPDAVLTPWHRAPVSGAGLRLLLASVADLKSPIRLEATVALPAGDVALLGGEWSLSGLDDDHTPVRLAALVTAVARREVEPTGQQLWRIAVERWTTPEPRSLHLPDDPP